MNKRSRPFFSLRFLRQVTYNHEVAFHWSIPPAVKSITQKRSHCVTTQHSLSLVRPTDFLLFCFLWCKLYFYPTKLPFISDFFKSAWFFQWRHDVIVTSKTFVKSMMMMINLWFSIFCGQSTLFNTKAHLNSELFHPKSELWAPKNQKSRADQRLGSNFFEFLVQQEQFPPALLRAEITNTSLELKKNSNARF